MILMLQLNKMYKSLQLKEKVSKNLWQRKINLNHFHQNRLLN